MPTRQVLFGLALLGAAGTGWADDEFMFNLAGRTAETGSGAPSGVALPLPDNPASLAALSSSPADRAGWPLPAATGGYLAAPVAGGGLLVGQRVGERASVGLRMYEGVAPPEAGGAALAGRYLNPEPVSTGLTVQPTFAYRISDALSVGIGLRFVQGALLGSPAPGAASAGVSPAYRDSDTSTGVDLGLLYQLGENTWLGLNYASSSRLDLDARYGSVNPMANLALGLPEGNRSIAGLQTPQTVTANLAHRLDSGWMLSASLGWQDWNGFDRSTGEAQALGAVERQYQDTWRLSLGAEQQLSERLSWSVGLKYGSSSRGGRGRTPSDPMPENLRLAAGLRYQMEEGMELQFGYNLVRLGAPQARPNKRMSADNALSAEPANSTVRVIGGGMVWRF